MEPIVPLILSKLMRSSGMVIFGPVVVLRS